MAEIVDSQTSHRNGYLPMVLRFTSRVLPNGTTNENRMLAFPNGIRCENRRIIRSYHD